MKNLPDKIKEALIKLKATHTHYVEVKSIKGRYYAFEVTGKWNKELKKKSKVTHYLGRIRDDGVFLPAKHRNKILQTLSPENPIQEPVNKYDDVIIRNLTMNGRMPMPSLAKKLGLSVTATRYQVNKVEEKYGIRYIAEIDFGRIIGYTTYVAFVKFVDKVPNVEDIRTAMQDEPSISAAALISGTYDLAIFLIITDNQQLLNLINKLRTQTTLKDYESLWYFSLRYNTYNFIPARAKFFDLLEEKVWKKTTEQPRPRGGELNYREFIVLKELTNNGKINFSEIDKKYEWDSGASQYTFHKLTEEGTIVRTTITMEKLPIKYNALFIANILDDEKFLKARPHRLQKIITDNNALINKYVFVATIGTPYSQIYICPILQDDDLIGYKNEMQEINKGSSINMSIITNMLVGNLCYRSLDNMYSYPYQTLANEYKMPQPKQPAEYE